MGICLFAECSTEVEELLAGVPAGTAARLEVFKQSVADRSLRFSFACLVQYAEYLSAGYLPDFKQAASFELGLDPDLNRLDNFRLFGWGTATTQVRALFPDQGASFDEDGCGSVTDPALMSQVLATQGVVVPAETLSRITALFCA